MRAGLPGFAVAATEVARSYRLVPAVFIRGFLLPGHSMALGG